MKYLDGNYYVEVKDHRNKNHPSYNITIRLQDEPKFLRPQYQVQNDIQIRKNQKDIKNANNELIIQKYPKIEQTINQQPNFTPPHSRNCKRNNRLEFDKE